MTSINFGKTSGFDVEKMAYDITGTPRNTEQVVYPTGVATRLSAPFGEPPVKQEETKVKVSVVQGGSTKVVVPAPAKVTVPVGDKFVTAAQSVGLNDMVE